MARLPRPVTMMISDRPEATASSTTYWIIGLSTRGSISFGCAFVAGRNRVPRPAAGKTPLRTLTGSSYCSGSRSPTPDALHDRHGGQDEDQQHALPLGEAELLEAMVDVIASGVGEPLGQ